MSQSSNICEPGSRAGIVRPIIVETYKNCPRYCEQIVKLSLHPRKDFWTSSLLNCIQLPFRVKFICSEFLFYFDYVHLIHVLIFDNKLDIAA